LAWDKVLLSAISRREIRNRKKHHSNTIKWIIKKRTFLSSFF